MRIGIAALSGVVLAALLSFGLVQANAAGKDPVTKPLYNYGSR
jgi:hypothetical protein